MAGSSPSEEIPSGMPQPGDVFAGKYRIERVLGVGGMGVVFSATHLQLDERVALKLIRPECVEPEFLARFQREGRAAVKIRSAHVARVLDVGADERNISYLVMEHLEGSDLGASAGALPMATVVDYVVQACDALAHAHALGIVHRDIKPSNLFAANEIDGACIKVLDFGIAKAAVVDAPGSDFKLTRTDGTMGSPLYMSPEQIRSTREVDARGDIWALGVVLFELVSGQMPFEGRSVPAIAASIVTDAPRSLRALKPDVPPQLEAIITRCLEKSPDERWPDVGRLAEALAPFGTTETSARAARIARVVAGSSPRLRVPASDPRLLTGAGGDFEPTSPADGRSTSGSWGGASRKAGRPRRTMVIAVVAGSLAMATVGIVLATTTLRARETPRPLVATSPELTATPSAASAASLPSAAPTPEASAALVDEPAPSAQRDASTLPAATAPSARKVVRVAPTASGTAAPATDAPPPPAATPTSSSGLVRNRHGG